MTPHFPHHNQSGCEHKPDQGGVFCDGTVQVRRLAFFGATPTNIMFGMAMKVIRWDDDLFDTNGGAYNKTLYQANKTEHSSFFFKKSLDPAMGWAVPFVTGHKYKISFGMTGLDFEQLTMTRSENWKADDLSIYLVHNWTDVRQRISVQDGGSNGLDIDNNTISATKTDWKFG